MFYNIWQLFSFFYISRNADLGKIALLSILNIYIFFFLIKQMELLIFTASEKF